MHIPNRMEDHTISRSKGSFGDERHTTKVGYDDSSILASSLSFQSTILFRGDFLKLSHYIQYTIFLIVQSWDTNKTLNLTTTILEQFSQKIWLIFYIYHSLICKGQILFILFALTKWVAMTLIQFHFHFEQHLFTV